MRLNFLKILVMADPSPSPNPNPNPGSNPNPNPNPDFNPKAVEAMKMKNQAIRAARAGVLCYCLSKQLDGAMELFQRDIA